MALTISTAVKATERNRIENSPVHTNSPTLIDSNTFQYAHIRMYTPGERERESRRIAWIRSSIFAVNWMGWYNLNLWSSATATLALEHTATAWSRSKRQWHVNNTNDTWQKKLHEIVEQRIKQISGCRSKFECVVGMCEHANTCWMAWVGGRLWWMLFTLLIISICCNAF